MSEKNPVCIIVDSGSDMLSSEAQRLGITLIPLKIRFGNEEFDDGVTISRDEFYDRLENSGIVPKTSQVTPYRYGEYFKTAVEAGQEVVCLTLSSNISGSYQSAVMAAAEYPGKIHLVDTLQFCGSEYILAQRGSELRDQGLSASEIAATLNEEKKHVHVIALFDTLEYLRLGGRLPSAVAYVGDLLNIKPVLTIHDGKVKILGKARGSKKATNHLMQFVREQGGIDWSRPILLSWSGKSADALEKYITDSAVLYEGREASSLPRSRVGATIGTYSGPDAIAFSFFANH